MQGVLSKEDRRDGRSVRRTRSLVARQWGSAWLLLAALTPPSVAVPQAEPNDSLDELMAAVQQDYKQSSKKYDALAKKVEQAVHAAISAQVWLDAAGADSERRFSEHPAFVFIDELSEATKSDAKKRSKNSRELKQLLSKYPWDKELELPKGLAYGSDRAVPDHDNGFIRLGRPKSFPGFPDLPINQYLYGFDEIVGWQYRVKSGRKLSFGGRTSKDKPVMAMELSGWDALRVYLQGTVPDVPLFAIPWMTHRIHARLTERRREADGGAGPMDELLALMDSRWNGFYFEPPYCKNRVAIVQPLHELYADRKGFVYQFPGSDRLESVGDLPFISVQTLERYADVMLDQRIGPRDFIAGTPQATAASKRFQNENMYITRYKWLVDEIVRAIVAPTTPYPCYLKNSDFQSGAWPDHREVRRHFEVPRKYAVVLWAWSAKDPDRLADFLYDKLLSQGAHQFPNDSALQARLVDVVRKHESELMQAVVERIMTDRGDGGRPGDYEREFSPYATYLSTDGKPQSDYLLNSFQSFHEEAAVVVRDAAYAAVLKEVF